MVTFSEFFAENYSLVVGVAERRLGSHHDAEDIATEAFRIAWERYDSGGELSVLWLYGVARNLVGNEYRSKFRRSALQDRLVSEHSDAQPTEENIYGYVHDAMTLLPAPYREVLLMTYWDGLSSQEAARILGVTPMTVRTRLSRARRLLKDELAHINEPRDIGHEMTQLEVSQNEGQDW